MISFILIPPTCLVNKNSKQCVVEGRKTGLQLVSVLFLWLWPNTLIKATWGERVHLSSQLRVQSATAGTSRGQVLEAAGQGHSQEQGEEKSRPARAQLNTSLDSHSSGSPTTAIVTPTVAGASHLSWHTPGNAEQTLSTS